jgi:glycosyltransferase involved in cell wall biosynthesis
VKGIHHFVPVVHRGDAVGRHTLRIRDETRARGYESHIYVDIVEEDTKADTVPVVEFPVPSSDDVLVYQFATASAMAPWLAGRPERLVVNYHNITPPELFAPWDNHLALGQLRAQADLALLAPRTALAIADSAYNEGHLVVAGFSRTAVVPPSAALPADLSGAESGPDRRDSRVPGGARWLSVGRVSPNKAMHDTIAALAVTRTRSDPAATLLIIGKPALESYDRALHRYVADLGLTGAVTFGGHASDAALSRAYAQADVLVVTSEHEGFCVPVVEAMSVGLPVVAFGQGALPEILGSAGVVVDSKDPFVLSSVIGALLDDAPRRELLRHSARQRLAELDLDSAAERFVDLLSDVAERGAPTP